MPEFVERQYELGALGTSDKLVTLRRGIESDPVVPSEIRTNANTQMSPDYSTEEHLIKLGFNAICGVDEAGRGPLAGPVVAAAVILDPQAIPAGLNDSKKLSEKVRVALFEDILNSSHVSIASVGARAIDRINIREASLNAMSLAIRGLSTMADHALIDGNALPEGLPCEASALIKGDARSVSIAAASIVAKVTRDAMMVAASNQFPEYGFENHKGYGTKVHMEELNRIGPCPLHRMTFAPVAAAQKNPAA